VLVDSSAWLAILFREVDHLVFIEKLRQSSIVRIAAPGILEATMAATGRLGPSGADEMRALLDVYNAGIVPFGRDTAYVATAAFLRFGKGQGHRAQLNFGDCISYATSKCEAMPLLFKGDDFRHTDVVSAI
jgi:ribonuclease VapC